MKEFIEKLIARLEEISVENTCSDCPYKAKCDEVQERIKDETTDLCGATIKALSIEIVNQLAEEYNVSEMPTGWIACSERLPEDGVVVDLSCEYMGVLYETVGYLKDGNRGHSYIVDNDVFMRSAVLAWRKRPAPYQPKGE